MAPFFLEEIPVVGKVHYQVLCVHGLNQSPVSSKPMLEDLSKLGIRCFLFHIPGHSPSDENHSDATKEIILHAYKNAYSSIKAKYDEPLGFLGYSFGGLIGTVMLDHCPFDKMILLAPALKIRTYSHALRPVLPYMSKIFSVPMGCAKREKHYRFHQKGVPSQVYKSFFDIYDELHESSLKNIDKTQSLVFCHPNDELVSYKGLKHWVEKNSSWDFSPIFNTGAEFGRYRHLIVDKTTLGVSSYSYLLEQMSSFYTRG